MWHLTNVLHSWSPVGYCRQGLCMCPEKKKPFSLVLPFLKCFLPSAFPAASAAFIQRNQTVPRDLCCCCCTVLPREPETKTESVVLIGLYSFSFSSSSSAILREGRIIISASTHCSEAVFGCRQLLRNAHLSLLARRRSGLSVRNRAGQTTRSAASRRSPWWWRWPWTSPPRWRGDCSGCRHGRWCPRMWGWQDLPVGSSENDELHPALGGAQKRAFESVSDS